MVKCKLSGFVAFGRSGRSSMISIDLARFPFRGSRTESSQPELRPNWLRSDRTVGICRIIRDRTRRSNRTRT